MGMKCAALVNRSMTTQIVSCPAGVLGGPHARLILMWSHFQLGTSNGCNNPLTLSWSAFTCWQVKHRATYFTTSFFIPGHLNCLCKSRYSCFLLGVSQTLNSKTPSILLPCMLREHTI